MGGGLIIPGCELTERGDVAEETVVSHFPVVFTLLDSSIRVSNSKGAVESKHQSHRKKDLSRWEQRFTFLVKASVQDRQDSKKLEEKTFPHPHLTD